MNRILLSIPHLSDSEERLVIETLRSNWVSTVGPDLAAFEKEFEDYIGLPSLAVSSGTAALHLGLRLLGVQERDEVFCQDLTFVASANPIHYLGATPVFIDSDYATWNMDPDILARALKAKASIGKLPKAVIVVHLFGQCASMDPIVELCERYSIPILEDAAEALGSTYRNRAAGTFGSVSAFSFNGNKIITTAGGGMLVSRNRDLIDRARHWSTQARDAGLGYRHSELGYNYRMSNVLAAIGRGQLKVLNVRVAQRRAIAFRYRSAFRDLPGIDFMPQHSHGKHTNWLSCFLIDSREAGLTRDELIRILDQLGIEARPVWKPMHLQELYCNCEHFGGSVAADLFSRGICLPSSSSLTPYEQTRVIDAVRSAWGAPLYAGPHTDDSSLEESVRCL
jgi:pyridoxal phosphate-dependent aminotransferase EpsN